MLKRWFISLPLVIVGCGSAPQESPPVADEPVAPEVYETIGAIKEPPGFKRDSASPGSFSVWLRTIPLKKDKTVYLYNGSRKRNQYAQFAVLDISVGNKDLQQCADAVMRLRAEYLYAQKRFSAIAFMDYGGKWYKWGGTDNRPAFDNYLQTVFGWCGSASLEKQLKPVTDFNEMKAGDVFVHGGFPGHAMIVADIAVNEKGEKVFMLVQGYQPAQDIHVVINPNDNKLSPWYSITEENEISTPEWTFYKNELRMW
jgi:Domain of unknown function (4846)